MTVMSEETALREQCVVIFIDSKDSCKYFENLTENLLHHKPILVKKIITIIWFDFIL